MIEITIPFDGFYESRMDAEIQMAEIQVCENKSFDEPEPDFNYEKIRNILAEEYCKAYNAEFEEEHGFSLKLQFVKLYSPKEYNFETDTIFALACPEALKKATGMVPDVKKILQEAYKPRGGFLPFTATLEAIASGKYLPRMYGEVILEQLLSWERVYDSTQNFTEVIQNTVIENEI